MKNWVPLWNGLVDSSLWQEPDHVFRVFMAMMTLKDADHIVRLDSHKLARRLHMQKDYPKVADALKILSEPDRFQPDQEFQGRRIKLVAEGYLILNADKYREMMKIEMQRARNRQAQAAWRARQKKGVALPGENLNERAVNKGRPALDPNDFCKEDSVPYQV
jgi:hypothetical protein